MIYKAIIFFAFLLILLAAAAFLGPAKNYEFNNPKISSLSAKNNAILPRLADSNQDNQQEDFSFLLLGKVGSGQGGQWHSAPNLADTIILVNFEQQEKTVNLISLPRDLYGNFGGENFKLNEVAYRKKISQLSDKLPEITGIKTEKFAIIDLGIVKKFVDEIGGVYIELTSKVIDPVSGYAMEPGYHHLSGDDTVWLIRNRFAPGGDFFREKNQHLIIEAIYRRYKLLSGFEKMKLFLELGPKIKKIETNIDFSELLSLTSELDNLKFREIILDFSTGLLESSTAPVGSSTAYILIPKTGINNYEEIKKFITDRLD